MIWLGNDIRDGNGIRVDLKQEIWREKKIKERKKKESEMYLQSESGNVKQR